MIKQIDTQESIARILTTPLGSRVMLPLYGSELYKLIDKTVDEEWIIDATRYTYEALEINEKNITVKKVSIKTGNETIITIDYLENGNLYNLEVPYAA